MSDTDESSLIEAWEEYNEKASDEAENRLLAEAWKVCEEEFASRRDEDYEVDEGQMEKFTEAYTFFCKLAEEFGGEVEAVENQPKRLHASMSVKFHFLDMDGETLKKFSKIVGNMLSLGIEPTSDGRFCVEFNVPDVYKRKIFKLMPH